MSKKGLGGDLMSIKEFAGFVGMTPSALRHYDSQGIFVPTERGVGLANNYRYYSAIQITTVKMVRVLAEMDVPLKTIKELAQERSPEKLIKVLSRSKEKIADEISFMQEVHSVISTFLTLLNEGISVTETEIYVSETPERPIVLGDINNYGETAAYFGEFVRFCGLPHLNTSYPIGGYWESMAEFMNEPSLPTRFFSLDPKGDGQKAAGLYLIGYTRGKYGQTNDLPERMAEFARKNGLVFSGPVFNIYLFDEISMANPNEYLLQASAAVTETRRAPSRRPRSRL